MFTFTFNLFNHSFPYFSIKTIITPNQSLVKALEITVTL